MNNKKIKEIITVIGIALLLLVFFVGILIHFNRKEGLTSTVGNEETEEMVINENDDKNATWETEEFKKQTSSKKEKADTAQKGGSKTLEIILPKEDANKEVSGEKETNWIKGIW